MWARIKKTVGDQRGEMEKRGSFGRWIGIIVILCFLLPAIMMLIQTNSTSYAKSRLEDNGYVVLSAAEYSGLVTLLNNIHDDAQAANEAAVLAAATSENILDKLLLFNENEAFLFSDNTNNTVNLVAGTPANTFSAWAEVTDNVGTTLSSKFAAQAGYIREVTLYAYGTGDKLCILELAYGPDVDHLTTIGRCFVRSDFTWVLNIYSRQVPAGSKIYQRLMSEQAGMTYKANFKYLYVV